MSSLMHEFKEFVLRGSVLDLAIAFILGLAFNTVVQSFVNDVLMNLVAAIFGEPDFSSLTFGLGDGLIRYGAFLTAAVNFVLIAAALFALVKVLNRMRRPRGAPAEGPTTRECPYCLTAIPVTATRCSACTSEVEPQAA